MQLTKIAVASLALAAGIVQAQTLDISFTAGGSVIAYLDDDLYVPTNASAIPFVNAPLPGTADDGSGSFATNVSPLFALIKVTGTSPTLDANLTINNVVGQQAYHFLNNSNVISTAETSFWQVATLYSGTGCSQDAPCPVNDLAGSTIGWSGNQFDSNGPFAIYSVRIEAGNVVSAVPEPESYALALLCLGGLGFASRRRKQAEAGQVLA